MQKNVTAHHNQHQITDHTLYYLTTADSVTQTGDVKLIRPSEGAGPRDYMFEMEHIIIMQLKLKMSAI